jgi:hypothetical protein
VKNFVACGILAIFLGTLWAHPVLAQSRLFLTDQSGFSLAAGFSSADDVSSIGAAVAMTAKARFDLGIAVSRLSFDHSVVGTDGTGVEIRPFVTWGVVRPANSLKLGVELAAGYSKGVFSSDGFRTEGWLQGRDALNIGANFYFRLRSSPGLVIYPGFSVDYVKFDLDGGLSRAEDDDEMAYGLDLTFLFDENVFITPSYQSLGGEKSTVVSIGFLIPGT